jgi:hypothetical protein
MRALTPMEIRRLFPVSEKKKPARRTESIFGEKITSHRSPVRATASSKREEVPLESRLKALDMERTAAPRISISK